MPSELLDVKTEPILSSQTPAPGSEPSGWMPLSDEQRNTVPENLKELFKTKGWTSAEQIANCYVDLENYVGKGEHIFKPESLDDTDGWAKFWQQHGVPDTAEGYEYEADEAVPFDDELLTRFKKFSKDIHLNKEQSAGLLGFQREIIKEVMATEVQAEADAVATDEAEKDVVRKALVQRYGGEVNYKNKVTDARRIADELGIYQTLEKHGLTSNPEIIGMLTDISEKVAEGVIGKGGEPPAGTKDPQDELKEIMASEAFKGKFHPQHKEIMKRYMELNQIIANSGLAPKRVQGG